MYKNLSIALLIATFGLVAARSTGTPASTPTSPIILKKVALVNQTAPIPTTTIFNPGTTGLFRVSVYMTQTVVSGSSDNWEYNLSWSDDAGAETIAEPYGALVLGNGQRPPMAYGSMVSIGTPGNVAIIEAVAGQPVTFSVGTTDGTLGTGAYSLYFTVERMI